MHWSWETSFMISYKNVEVQVVNDCTSKQDLTDVAGDP